MCLSVFTLGNVIQARKSTSLRKMNLDSLENKNWVLLFPYSFLMILYLMSFQWLCLYFPDSRFCSVYIDLSAFLWGIVLFCNVYFMDIKNKNHKFCTVCLIYRPGIFYPLYQQWRRKACMHSARHRLCSFRKTDVHEIVITESSRDLASTGLERGNDSCSSWWQRSFYGLSQMPPSVDVCSVLLELCSINGVDQSNFCWAFGS